MGLLGLCGDLRTMRDLLRLHESEQVQTCKRKDRGEKTKCFFFRFKKIESEKKKERIYVRALQYIFWFLQRKVVTQLLGLQLSGENFLSRKEFGKRKKYENFKFSYFFANSTIIFVWLAFYVSPTTQKEMK